MLDYILKVLVQYPTFTCGARERWTEDYGNQVIKEYVFNRSFAIRVPPGYPLYSTVQKGFRPAEAGQQNVISTYKNTL